MTKREMLAFLDTTLEQIRQRGIVSAGITRTKLRTQHVGVTAIRRAIEAHVPNDVAPPEQTGLKGVA